MECKDDEYRELEGRGDDHNHGTQTEPETYRTEILNPLENVLKYQLEMGYVSKVLIETAPYANYPYRCTPLCSSDSDENCEHLEKSNSTSDSDLHPESSSSSPPESSDVFAEINTDSLSITQRLRKRLGRKDSSSDSDLQPTPEKKLRVSSVNSEFNKDSRKVDSAYRKLQLITQTPSLQSKKLEELKELINILETDHQARVFSYSKKRKLDGTLKKLDISKAYGYANDNHEYSTTDSGFSSASSTLTQTSETLSPENLEEQVAVETQLIELDTNSGLIAEDKILNVPRTSVLAEDFKDKGNRGDQNAVFLNIKDYEASDTRVNSLCSWGCFS